MRHGIRLGIDVGSVRVGVASCDPDGLIATPVVTLTRDEKGGSDLRQVAEIVAERGVIEVIVGNPVHLNGRVGVSASLARAYAETLAGMVAPVTVRLVDERLTTVTAHQQLRGSGAKPGTKGTRAGRKGQKQRGHRDVIDQVAAVVILQNALDSEKASGREPGTMVAPSGSTDGPSPG